MSDNPQIDLGDGLVLRLANPGDAKALADFNARLHSDNGPEQPDEKIYAWVTDLMEKPHPTFQPADFTVVEDSKKREIVSSLNLISQIWSYAGIPFNVGRPELVGTTPEYRNRGLVRAQMELIHKISVSRGQKVLGITGIPYYYRQFGYEMAMELGGGRVGFKRAIPMLEENDLEPYNIRAAQESDLEFISNLYQEANTRYLVSVIRDIPSWQYEINGKNPNNVNRSEIRMIETRDGQPVGYFVHPINNWGPNLVATQYEINPDRNWSVITPSVMRYLFTTGQQFAAQSKQTAECDGFGFWLGLTHPIYQVIPESLPMVRKPYAWYLRVADLPDFLNYISPALEVNISNSPYHGYSGEINITFYTSGLKMILENGQLRKITSNKPEPVGHSGDAAFPGLTFLQLLFGYRSLEELNYSFPDCWTSNQKIAGVLSCLFPKRASNLWPIS